MAKDLGEVISAKAHRRLTFERTGPDVITTANIGCQLHLQIGPETPVCHWIELIDEALT